MGIRLKSKYILAALLVSSLTWAQEGLKGSGEYVGTVIPASHHDRIATTVGFNVTLWNFTPEAESAFYYALGLVAPYLNLNQDIRLQAIYGLPILGGTLGICIPNSDRDFSILAEDLVWYPASLANAISGNDLQPNELDFNMFIWNANWYTGTDGNCGANQYDLVTVVLHELMHGLGFISLMSVEGALGKYNDPDSSNFYFTTFPRPDFNELPGIYDQHLNYNGRYLIDTTEFSNFSIALRQAITSDSIFFSGPMTNAFLNGDQARVYAPLNYQDGSSIHHLDESTYPAGSTLSLMTPFVGLSEVNHSVDSLCLSVLNNTGRGGASIGIKENRAETSIYPIPNHGILSISSNTQIVSIELFDLNGVKHDFEAMVMTTNYCKFDVRNLPKGIYVLRLEGIKGVDVRKILVE